MSVYHYLSQFAVIKGLTLDKKMASADYPMFH